MSTSFFSPQLHHAILLSSVFSLGGCASAAENLAVPTLDLSKTEQDWGQAQRNKSVDGKPLSIGGKSFENGIGTHANSTLVLDLKKSATRFTAFVGIDDEVKANPSATVEFLVIGDGKILWQSGVMKSGEAAQKVDVDLSGVQILMLQITDANDGIGADHGDWAEPKIEYVGIVPVAVTFSRKAEILTPKPAKTPRINGPKVFGVRPGSPVIYSIPATGLRPMTFSSSKLPTGLRLDPTTGRFSGTLKTAGEYKLTLRAKNSLGSAEKTFRIVVGEKIALTPPLGWNSYNCWGDQVDQEKVLRSAKALVASGLDRHGWSYINIDDAWQGQRGGPLNAIQPDPKKFPDMKALADEVHGLGLKLGIYSSPWVTTYAGRVGGSSENLQGEWDAATMRQGPKNIRVLPFSLGKYSFAKQDAQQFANWGIDYLKYDWGPVEAGPAKEIHEAMRATGRDIVLSLSNNAAQNLFGEIGDVSRHAEAWRTTHDIDDSWRNVSGIGFSQDKWAPFQSPGRWNDADMLVVGHVGWGNPHPTKLTPDEQYTHITLWSLLATPLLIGCDLEKLDEFTISLLSNDEVLGVNQDPLGKQGTRVSSQGNLDVYSKPLEDGSLAVGLFNQGAIEAPVIAKWSDLGLKGRQRVRDLWRQKDIGTFSGQFQATVPRHGAYFVRIFPTK